MEINARIVNVEERARLLKLAHALGCRVYQRNPETDTWFYYTDGKNIGYAQFPARDCSSLSTVHMPNTTTGTGYAMTDRYQEIGGKEMCVTMLTTRPSWALTSDPVTKYRDWEHFANSSPWHKGYSEVNA